MRGVGYWLPLEGLFQYILIFLYLSEFGDGKMFDVSQRPHTRQHNHQHRHTLMATVQEEQERSSVARLESQLTREKQELQNDLTALMAKKNNAKDPTADSEAALDAATTVCMFFFNFFCSLFFNFRGFL